MHTLIVIGYTGISRAYLDIPEEEAIRRYCESEDTPRESFNIEREKVSGFMDTFTFTDEFCVYSAWPNYDKDSHNIP